jgi:membrane protein CcdC involved in cytochrome C biogenesis
MDLDGPSLFASFMIGLVGMAIFTYGKKQSRWPQMGVGVVLMVYPYFVSNVAVMGAIAVGLVLALWGAIHLGA